MKIGLLIPSTSNGRNWETYKDTYLFMYTLKTFLLTYDKEYNYIFYIGIDKNDKIYDNIEEQKQFIRFCSIMKNVDIQFIYMDNIPKGHLTIMWNRLFDIAYKENCDYFFQCGDDIEFKTKGWVNACIDILVQSDNFGMTGPINNNNLILTQSFVSRKHMELFGYYFPEEIINWCCDDWINLVYRNLNKYYPLNQHYCGNLGGEPRYIINNDDQFIEQTNFRNNLKNLRDECDVIVKRDIERIKVKQSK